MALSARSQNGEIEETHDGDPTSFPRFDVVSDDSDHYYLNNSKAKRDGQDSFTNGTGGVHKKIMQEWRILEKNLPDSISVRVYEKRIDLLRAVIVGAAGTPYHDGLFFFDLAFPADYPNRPPTVYYRSCGLRLNPNLYANGRVCLSLLNTWAGKKSEKWNPAESTVLQVLVSIQALVLNEKPYFNEPGHGTWPGRTLWEKKSNAYSEDVFLLSCKTMLFLLRRPPKNFEAFVVSHFRNRAGVILSACKAYAFGECRVGYYINDESSSSGSTIDVPEKFKGSMEQLYLELVAAFRRCGASLGNCVEQLKVKSKTAPLNGQVVVKKKRGFTKKMIGKLKKILGMVKKNKSIKANAKSSRARGKVEEKGESGTERALSLVTV